MPADTPLVISLGLYNNFTLDQCAQVAPYTMAVLDLTSGKVPPTDTCKTHHDGIASKKAVESSAAGAHKLTTPSELADVWQLAGHGLTIESLVTKARNPSASSVVQPKLPNRSKGVTPRRQESAPQCTCLDGPCGQCPTGFVSGLGSVPLEPSLTSLLSLLAAIVSGHVVCVCMAKRQRSPDRTLGRFWCCEPDP